MRARNVVLGGGAAILLLAWIGLTVWMGGVILRALQERGGAFDPTILGADYQRHALRTMSELFPTRTVSRGGAVSEVEVARFAVETSTG